MDYRHLTLACTLLTALAGGCRDDGGGGGSESTGGDSSSTSPPADTTGPDTTSTDTFGASTTASDATTEIDPTSRTTTGERDTEDIPATCDDGTVVAGELCFGPPSVIEANRSTAAIEIADFDGDGVPDIVAGHDDGLSVRYGVGDGTFEGTLDALPLGSVLALAVRDLDGEDGPDIIAALPELDEVTVLLGNGDDFDQGPTLSSEFGPRALALGDFDDDGIEDLAIAHEVDDDFHVTLGNGDGTFSDVLEVPTGTSPLGVAAANLDGLSGDDLAVASFGSNTVSLYLSEGSGFGPSDAYPAGAGPRDVVLADFDGDGLIDLGAIHQDAGTAGFWPGNGDGTLGDHRVRVIGANARDATAADVDADGIPDMIVALQAGNAVGVLRGSPDEGLDEPDVFGTMSAPTAVAAADLNADGAVDLVTASAGPQGGIAVILATP